MKLTVVIPTKNRKKDLETLVDSLILQSKLPDELIIVDQSLSSESQKVISEKWNSISKSQLVYILDSRIEGLVAAKSVGSEQAKNEVICFLDDDLILDAHFLREIVKPFLQDGRVRGVSGVFINFPKTSKLYKIMYSLFHKGIFSDPRPIVYKEYKGYSNPLVETSVLWGGITAWRSEVLKQVPFDTTNSLFMMEDFDYSRKIRETLGGGLFVSPNARAIHNHSVTNRASEADQEERKVFEYISYYKKSRRDKFSFVQLVWLLIGLFLHVVLKSFLDGNLALIKAYIDGIKKGKMSQLR